MEYQVARMLYQFRKLPLIRRGDLSVEQGGNVEFELFGFFEICYHLKDWLKEDPDYSSWENVEKFIDNSQPLSICADICNTLKHRRLNKKPRSGKAPGYFSICSVTSVGPDGITIEIQRATIDTVRGETCCFSLAAECLAEWERYFEKNNINSSLREFLHLN